MKDNTIKTIDAAGRTLGRVASEVAMSLMGKTKATFERNKYCGFPVKVINAGKIKITVKNFCIHNEELFQTSILDLNG